MRVREAAPADAAMLLALQERLAVETAFLDWEPGERTIVPEAYGRRMAAGIESGNWMMFVAEDVDAASGCAWAQLGHVRRTQHVMHLGLGVVQSAWGRGIGSALIAAAESWGAQRGVVRLELFVQPSNLRALRLYERIGFQSEGVKRCARRIDGRYVDECVMAKLVGDRSGVATGPGSEPSL